MNLRLPNQFLKRLTSCQAQLYVGTDKKRLTQPRRKKIVKMTYCMNVQHVDGEVVGRQVHRLEDLVQGHRLPVLGQADGRVGLGLERLLDEAQQVLLVHAGGRVDVGVHLKIKQLYLKTCLVVVRKLEKLV